MKAIIIALAIAIPVRAHAGECKCMSVAADVAASVQADVMKADNLYARGDFSAALAIYTKAYATSKDAALLYAQGMASWQLGDSIKAKAMLSAYLAAGGALAYKDRVEGSLRDIGAGVTAPVSGAVGGALGTGVEAASFAGGAGLGVAGEVRGSVDKPKNKIGRNAGIVLGVIAVAAVGAVGIHSIAAGVSKDIDLDPKFDLGLGVAGVAVGISAFYVAGLTATTTTVSGVRCATLPKGQPIVAPYATQNGGGIAAAMSF